jgi:hypothetical protein
VYPVTIIRTRYGGSYEGGAWAAFHCHEDAVPANATGDDLTCATYWWSSEAGLVGRGATPDEALANLEDRLGWERADER